MNTRGTMHRHITRFTARFLIAATALCLPAALRSEDRLSLENAISLALKNDDTFILSVEKEKEAEAKISEAWGKLWPDLGFSFSGTRWDADKGTYANSDGQIDFRFIKGSFELNPGSFYNNLQTARSNHIISVNETRKVRSETIARAIQLYYLAFLDGEIRGMREESVKALEENYRVVQMGVKSGTLSPIDNLRAKVSLANEKTRLINAENDYLNAISSLDILTGKDAATALVLDHDSLNPPEDEIGGILGMTQSAQQLKTDELISISMKNRPELIQIRFRKNVSESMRNADQSVYLWPTFFINGNYGTSKIVNKQIVPESQPYAELLNQISDSLSPPGWNKSWSVTAGISYKWGALSPLDQSHAKAESDESRMRQSDIETDRFIKQLRLEIQKDILRMVSAAHALDSQKDNIQSAREYFRIAVIQFRNGMIDNTKLLDANVELKSAQTLFIQAFYDYQTSKADLNRALGTDYFTIK